MPVVSDIVVSVVECHSADDGGAVVSIMYGDAPGLTADLTVFDVVLVFAASRVEADRICFAAVRTGDLAARVGGAVAERKVSIEIELVVGLVVELTVEREAHTSNLQRDASGGLTIPACPISSPLARRWRCRSAFTSCSPRSGSRCRC